MPIFTCGRNLKWPPGATLDTPEDQPSMARVGHFEPQLAAKPSTAQRTNVGAKVPILDDNVRDMFAVKALFKTYDMTVIEAENGIDTLPVRIARVLIDIKMPEIDG